jgi:2'-5' RNA ligase
MKFRAFISADIAPNEKLVSLLRQLAMSRADLKVVRPELVHVTLKFLGDTEESMVDQIEELIKGCAKGVLPFTVRLRGMGAFPSMSNMRVVWVGMEDAQPLGQIANRLDDSLKALGFERDSKGFKPHLTLARTRSARNIANLQEIIRENAATDFGDYPVDSIRLKKSVLSPSGPTYSVVREIML